MLPPAKMRCRPSTLIDSLQATPPYDMHHNAELTSVLLSFMVAHFAQPLSSRSSSFQQPVISSTLSLTAVTYSAP